MNKELIFEIYLVVSIDMFSSLPLHRLFGILVFVHGGYSGFRYSSVMTVKRCIIAHYFGITLCRYQTSANLLLHSLITSKLAVVTGTCITYWLFFCYLCTKTVLHPVKCKQCIYCLELFYLGMLTVGTTMKQENRRKRILV